MSEKKLVIENACIEYDGKNVTVTGEVNLKAYEKGFNGLHEYGVVDLSQATFIIDRERWAQFLGMSHWGPVYGNSGWRDVDVLKRVLQELKADKVILPADVARRHMNAIIKNEDIYEVEVPDDCKLFAMKDGNVYNKKLTKLVFQKRTPAESEQ